MNNNAVEIFYEKSHQTNVGDQHIPMLNINEAEKELLGTPHRYQCAYKYLQKNRPANAVELGFGSPRLLRALADGCVSYTIVDIVDRTGDTELPKTSSFYGQTSVLTLSSPMRLSTSLLR